MQRMWWLVCGLVACTFDDVLDDEETGSPQRPDDPSVPAPQPPPTPTPNETGDTGTSVVVETCPGDVPVLVSGVDGVYFEVEAIEATADWTEETADDGFFGDSYFQWIDARRGAPDDDDPFLAYCFAVETTGTYKLEVHGTRDNDVDTFCADAANDECNDIWVQIDGQGSGNQTWTKKMIKPPWGQWRWDANWDPQNGSPFPTEVELSAGPHLLGMAGRSHRVRIDAVRIYRVGTDAPEPPGN